MKKTRLIIILLLNAAFIYAQQENHNILHGSWMGRVTTEQFSARVLLRFENVNGKKKTWLDSPDQGLKGMRMDNAIIRNDSLLVDATSLDAGIIFKGRIMPGDSVIDGKWGGSMNLVLRPTDYVYTRKSNPNPQITGYRIIKLIKTTPLKDQQATNVCWSFATTSFIETEAIRLGKKPVVLSPMFYVIPTTVDKAEKIIRMNGNSRFSPGDLTFSVLKNYRKYGAIPQSVFPGRIDTTDTYDHSALDNALQKKVKELTGPDKGKLTSPGYRKAIKDIICKETGNIPESFIYENKIYTPLSFAKEMVGINPDDYIEVTSFSHHPFYTRFILEMESNWDNGSYLNLPLKELGDLVDHSLMKGYSVCWDGDAYRTGFHQGFATVSDTATITQERRQNDFDTFKTIDVHNMHIVGIAEDDTGKRYYIIKNSSDAMDCGGYLYMSKDYFLLKTISVMVNKNAIPDNILKKCGKL